MGGVIRRDKPEKLGPHSHVGDAFAHLMWVLLRKSKVERRGGRYGEQGRERRRVQPTRRLYAVSRTGV